MSIADELLKTIDYAIEKRTNYLTNMDVSGIIVGSNSNGSYIVLINETEYDVPNGSGISFKTGDLVWVHSPNGDFNKKYIISSRSPNSKAFANQGSGDYGHGATISPSDFITNEEIDAMFT